MNKNTKETTNCMTREEYINEARESGMTKEEINKYLKKHDKDEKENNIILPYEILPIFGEIIVEKFPTKKELDYYSKLK